MRAILAEHYYLLTSNRTPAALVTYIVTTDYTISYICPKLRK